MNILNSKLALVTVKVLTYNSAEYVWETLESIKSQTYQNIELVISDDCSSDPTVSICDKWVAENKDRFVRIEIITSPSNTGITANINRAVKASEGEWLKVIAGDDALMPDCIEKYMYYAERNPDASILFSNVCIYKDVFKETNIIEKQNLNNHPIINLNQSAGNQYQILLRAMSLRAPSLIIKKKVIEEVGGYDESIKNWEDRPMLLQLTQKGYKMHYVDMISAKYRKRSGSAEQRGVKIVTAHKINKTQYFLKNYVFELSFSERTALRITYLRDMLFYHSFIINRKNKVNARLYRLAGYPWDNILKKQKKFYTTV